MECRLIAKDIYSRIAEVRVQNKPTILLSPPVSYDGLVNRRACRVILRTYTAWTFLDGDFISSGAELSKASITKNLVSSETADQTPYLLTLTVLTHLTRVFQALYL